MDPITAAGIGLSVTSLALQVFSGCIKGYQLFIECKEMPAKFEHLRTRLRIEQTRCLHWGESVGLVEELLDEPSRILQLNQNLIMEILQQIQASFRACLAVTTKYDPYVRPRTPVPPASQQKPDAAAKHTFLQKTLAFWEKSGRAAGKLEWTLLKKDGFERLIGQLVEFNNSIESFLDRDTLKDLRSMHVQSNLMLLQMTDQIGELHDLVLALNLRAPEDAYGTRSFPQGLPHATGGNEAEDQTLLSLTVFKSHQANLRESNQFSEVQEIALDTIDLQPAGQRSKRQFGRLGERQVWLEWRENFGNAEEDYSNLVLERTQKLACVLSAKNKPVEFRSPDCIGYVCTNDGKRSGSSPRLALVLQMPNPNHRDVDVVSLRHLLNKRLGISLDIRIALVKQLAESLLSLHAVGWVHKGICSENILFLNKNRRIAFKEPILSGFETSRPAVPEEITFPFLSTEERDVYRHPELHSIDPPRSKRSHDIYSLGLVMAEIALWEPIESIARLEVRRSTIGKLRSTLLDKTKYVFPDIAERAGWRFADVVRICIEGGAALGIPNGANEEDSTVGLEMTKTFFRKVVLELASLKV